MEAPKMILYIAAESISGLLEQIDGGTLTEGSKSKITESSKGLSTGAEVGGLFFKLLNLGKLSLGTSRGDKKSSSESQKTLVGPYSHLSMVLRRLHPLLGKRYFESLDAAFESAPEDEASWIHTKDFFSLTNVGNEWSVEALEKERRFVFEINPNQDNYEDADEYYKTPPRKWSLVMSASFENCPRLRGKLPGSSSHEAMYFRRYNYVKIPLNVFGCFLKVGLHVQIIPYAIWI
jgi:hypothetical protein